MYALSNSVEGKFHSCTRSSDNSTQIAILNELGQDKNCSAREEADS